MLTRIYDFSACPEMEELYVLFRQALDQQTTLVKLNRKYPKKAIYGAYHMAQSESPYGYLYFQHRYFIVNCMGIQTVKLEMCRETSERITLDIQILPQVYKIVEEAAKFHSAYEIVRYVYQYFVDNFRYAKDKSDYSYHSAFSVFTNDGYSVCEGFSLAMAFVLNRLNIPCGVVMGNVMDGSGDGHVWNIVRIGRDVYHLDVTWDICLNNKLRKKFNYFLLDEKAMRLDHQWSDGAIPKALDASLDSMERIAKVDNIVEVIENGIKKREADIAIRYVGAHEMGLQPGELLKMFSRVAARNRIRGYNTVCSVGKTARTIHFYVNY